MDKTVLNVFVHYRTKSKLTPIEIIPFHSDDVVADALDAGGSGFGSSQVKSNAVSLTACYSCDVSLQFCCSGAKRRR